MGAVNCFFDGPVAAVIVFGVVQEQLCTTDPVRWRWRFAEFTRMHLSNHARQRSPPLFVKRLNISGQHMQAGGRGNPRSCAFTVAAPMSAGRGRTGCRAEFAGLRLGLRRLRAGGVRPSSHGPYQ